MRRVVVLTTPTSGTRSLWRMVSTLSPKWPHIAFIDECLAKGLTFDQIRKTELPAEGCFLFNQPHLFNFDQDLSDTHFLLNFRDPRDMSCNQYYWVFSHPRSNFSEEQLAAYREETRANGIDHYVLKVNNKTLFTAHQKILGMPDLMARSVPISYIQLCLAVPAVVRKIATLFGVEDEALIERMSLQEHPSMLTKSDRWIGGTWQGSDITPGRARVELNEQTFATLTQRYRTVLDDLARLDDPAYAFFYS